MLVGTFEMNFMPVAAFWVSFVLFQIFGVNFVVRVDACEVRRMYMVAVKCKFWRREKRQEGVFFCNSYF